MLIDVRFCGKIEAVAEPARGDWAVISIGEREAEEARLQPGWHSVLRLNFHDIDIHDVGASDYDLFTAEQARQIIDFVDAVVCAGVVGILVHCKAGISRSAAVAKWIAGSRYLSFNPNYMLYNRYVYKMLVQVSGEYVEAPLVDLNVDALSAENEFIDWTWRRGSELAVHQIRHVSNLEYRHLIVPVWLLRGVARLRLVRYEDLPVDLAAAFSQWQILAASPALGSSYLHDFRDFMSLGGRGWSGDFSAIVEKYTLND